MSDVAQLTAVCLRCGRPARPIGEHHQPPDRSSIGMGGTSDPHEHDWRLPLCRDCHDAVHRKEFALVREGPVVFCIVPETGEILAARALRPTSLDGRMEAPELDAATLAQHLNLLDDESLAFLWGAGLTWEEQGVVLEALAAEGFRSRYSSYGDAWYSRAAEVIRAATGKSISAGTIYDRWTLSVALSACGWDPVLLANLGRSVLAEAGKAEEPPTAIELALEMRDAGEPARRIVAEMRDLRRKVQTSEDLAAALEPTPAPDPAKVWARCPECGYVGWQDRLPAEVTLVSATPPTPSSPPSSAPSSEPPPSPAPTPSPTSSPTPASSSAPTSASSPSPSSPEPAPPPTPASSPPPPSTSTPTPEPSSTSSSRAARTSAGRGPA